MHDFFTLVAVYLTIVIFIPLYRVIAGPRLMDRMLGAGAIGTKTMVLILLIGYMFDRIDMFIDITLAYAVLNFIGVIAIAKYIERIARKR
ncbi:MAG: pH regulation protein F [Candidatus Aminicenantes bacterium]|nr:pH regulation protein F [Candidatus Aminicenantes bacterium]OQX53307.1 MAG: pH regulation protein F [Candidatus Aminicenantes bacterium 4484_214]RLE03976.1 MAG: pH regulation protein F [Candidatus Aminicenantes bacterium]RLE05930.1 MAG: pH regulation protein F [Candidatus Aminicenantes bacterium]HHF43580.1 pH regulation protein F [Candidatus Aminicenantes bacterium]